MKNMKNILGKIRLMVSTLPRAERVIAEALLENPDCITRMTLAQISKETGSSDASVIRFCKRMGYSGYTAMQQDFLQKLSESKDEMYALLYDGDSMTDIFKRLYQSDVQLLNNTLAGVGPACESALEALMKARSICFFGVGDAWIICRLAAMRFESLGIRCMAESDVVFQQMSARNLTGDDVAVAVSYEGRHSSVVEAMKTAKTMGATTISITKRSQSPLLKYTDIPLFVAANDLSANREKITRRVSEQFLLDGLYMAYMIKSGKRIQMPLGSTTRAPDD